MSVRVSSIMRANDCAKDFADIVISLVDPDTICPNFGPIAHKVFRMNDTDVQTDMFAPTSDDISAVFDAVSGKNNVLVHCIGGISRSTAVGIGILVSRGIAVKDAVNDIHTFSFNMSPNKLVLRHIDRHLNSNGQFFADVNAAVAALPKDLMLWCGDCKTHFIDGQNCPGNHWA